MTLAIGIAGPMRSGKETAQKLLRAKFEELGHNVEAHAFSDVVRETCDLWHQPRTRESQQGIVVKLRELWGADVLARVVKARVLNSKSNVVIVDGLRWPDSDHDVIRGPSNNYLIYIDAPAEVRWRRSTMNADKPDEARASFVEFLAKDKAPNEIEIHKFKDLANYVIDNSTDSFDNLERQVNDIFHKILNR